MSTRRAVLRLSDVVKTFPGVVALNGVSFEVAEGEVHALVGENGAGKSTLMAVAAGSTLPDRGEVEIGGRVMEQPSPAAAQALGLAVVYQQLSILEDLTVAENMVFAMPLGQRPRMSRAGPWTQERLGALGAAIDPSARVDELSTADRQLLEIAKALALDSRVLVLDEPTEALTHVESERLFEQIRSIRDGGTAVVYISHRLPEVMGIADRITVLRDGETRGTLSAEGVSEGEILQLIIGRSVEQVFPEKVASQAGESAPPLLQVEGLTGGNFRGVDLQVRPGEIVGLAGVEGNGQREFIRAVAGLEPSRGSVRLAGQAVGTRDPSQVRRSGIVYLPGDRHREGVLLSLSVRENISLLALRASTRLGVVRRRHEAREVSEQIEQLAIRTPSAETPVSSLSGGNQQKVLFARSSLAQPLVLLADEPTRGVDAGARIELYQVLRNTADEGKAVVVLSSDVIELQGLCSRVHVFSRGEVVRTVEGEEITEENITGAAITSSSRRAEVAARMRRMLRVRRFVAGDYLPSIILAVLIVALAAYTDGTNSRFLSNYNLAGPGGLLLLASALVFISLGQLMVLLTGGIDLSVGPLTGLTVVVLSFFATAGQGAGDLTLGILAVIGTALAVGLVNVSLIRVFRIAPVLATLAMFIVLEGVMLLLRPTPAGFLRPGVTDALKTNIGPLPAVFIAAMVVTVVCEILLRWSRPGLELRAVGSDETRAHRLGARVNATYVGAYVLASLFAAAGGIVLAAFLGVGSGDAAGSAPYTLKSISVVVLGGASIFGGRGSFVGAFLGAVLIQEIITATSFLQTTFPLSHIPAEAVPSWLLGFLILVGAGIYSRARGARSAILQEEAP